MCVQLQYTVDVDVIKQRNMVNSGVRDTKGMDLDLEGGVF